VEGFLVKLGANSSVAVAIDISYTLQFRKTAGIPKTHSKTHLLSIDQ